ncbi:unnamed protein product [Meloidogyne enterolobii]|uniref:Uncharacterized protein n=4 Tax=Meloidogyne enterolobii TaxID=390850 RepID=A0ACB0XN88_MELEN|nr:unnamed protein product [Meloidogyne enterolobii]
MFVFNKPWKKQAMLINAVSLLSVVFLLLLIEQVNTEGINIKLDMEGDDVSKASEGGKDALLTTDPPTAEEATTTTTTTKAATSATPQEEPPEGFLVNAAHGLQNLAGGSYRTKKLTPEEEAAAELGFVLVLIGFCCCCACCIGFVVLLVKVLSK